MPNSQKTQTYLLASEHLPKILPCNQCLAMCLLVNLFTTLLPNSNASSASTGTPWVSLLLCSPLPALHIVGTQFNIGWMNRAIFCHSPMTLMIICFGKISYAGKLMSSLDSLLAANIKILSVKMLSPSNFTSRNLLEVLLQRSTFKNTLAKLSEFVRNWGWDKRSLIRGCLKQWFSPRGPLKRPGGISGCRYWLLKVL